MLRRHPSRLSLLAALCALALSNAAHALERVNLQSGHFYDCFRHETTEEGKVRLYTYTPGSADDSRNYVEISADQIASVEPLPDPPPLPKPALVATSPAPTAPTDIHDLLVRAGAQHHIDAELLASIIHAESGGHARAVSHAGARGLMQLMPATARELGVTDAFEPGQNIDGGTAYLDALLTRYDPAGDRHGLDLALAAYNAGPVAVDRYHGIPPYRETHAYVARVEREFFRRTNLAKAAATSAATIVATR